LQLPEGRIKVGRSGVKCSVMVDGGGRPRADEHNWRLAVRVATAASGLGAALAAALHVFLGVNSGVLVLVAATVAVIIGFTLPAVTPGRSLRRLRELLYV
jgi:hypothetical protein